ncbi:transcription-repair-coupling factor [Bacteroidia bacterium]|nr:transcription-repair-coupling factor [Bacteroidia bacterium]
MLISDFINIFKLSDKVSQLATILSDNVFNGDDSRCNNTSNNDYARTCETSNVHLNNEQSEAVNPQFADLNEVLRGKHNVADEVIKSVIVKGLAGSAHSVVCSAIYKQINKNILFILQNKERAEYAYNDLGKLFEESLLDDEKKVARFFPHSYKKNYDEETIINSNVLMRAEVLNKLQTSVNDRNIVVSYPEAIEEKVVSKTFFSQQSLRLYVGQNILLDKLLEHLIDQDFDNVDFVVEPGQYALRGGIIDVFSYSSEYPYRIEFFGDEIGSIRSFDPVNQLSKVKYDNITILPNVVKSSYMEDKISCFEYFNKENTIVWIEDVNAFEKQQDLITSLKNYTIITGAGLYNTDITDNKNNSDKNNHNNSKNPSSDIEVFFNFSPQPVFSKQFNLLIDDLNWHTENNYTNIIISENPKQIQRLERIFFEIKDTKPFTFQTLPLSLHEGFIDNDKKVCCYTDHQIFERFHRFSTHRQVENKELITLQEIYNLKFGDYVTHIDYGVGQFVGLDITEIGGKNQETIKILYKDNDILYVSIHALHKISKYSGKEGEAPNLTRLGSQHWNNVKARAKQRIKDIARDLISLYAQRKSCDGYSFSADSFLQHELEASFIYEDTPDQYKATQDVKHDMESTMPMDRLICGDVGFGKTEVAIRGAFKAVADGKQVAVLVPTTILAFQHYQTFKERLANMPCKVEYISRFRTTKQIKNILKELEDGKIDIIIGTHRLISKDIKFKDLGLLVIDEEQKFGVAVKEKLKHLKVNVDTLTMTATPIPRTLQFSLMGARDMSIITTPPLNRFPVQTEIISFDEEKIREIIVQELSRGGQVFFINNRVQNINDIANIIQKLVPDANIAIGHGQMDGDKLENVMMSFIEGETDVLVATKIVENGLDIPNANTIIINEAQSYGLSELHQLRGRVGRSNKKSYCWLIAPPPYLLNDDAKKRLKVIEEFSNIGSGFSIAMRDLDIRGAGNILGAEQSGFISDIGFETYNAILEDAIRELKQNEFKYLFENDDDVKEEITAKDCTIETDLELLIPSEYVNNVSERFHLYKTLDTLKTDEDLEKFAENLRDRFGEIPPQTKELLLSLKMRRMAQKLGFEKVMLRQKQFVGTFIADTQFFKTETFDKILIFAKENPKKVEFKNVNDVMKMLFKDTPNVETVIEIFDTILL